MKPYSIQLQLCDKIVDNYFCGGYSIWLFHVLAPTPQLAMAQASAAVLEQLHDSLSKQEMSVIRDQYDLEDIILNVNVFDGHIQYPFAPKYPKENIIKHSRMLALCATLLGIFSGCANPPGHVPYESGLQPDDLLFLWDIPEEPNYTSPWVQ